MIALALYTAGYAPYRTAFMHHESSDVLYAFECLVDLLLLIDIFVTFLTPYERLDGNFEHSFKKISRNYLISQTFLFDLVAIIPTQFFATGVKFAARNAFLGLFRIQSQRQI